MRIKTGQIIKLKNYAGHAGRTGQYAQVQSVGNDTISLKWISDNRISSSAKENVQIFKTKRVAELRATLVTGMEVITNVNGETSTTDTFYQGRIGEILANAEGKNTAYIWNNKYHGAEGQVTRPQEYLHTWKVKLTNNSARMIIIGDASFEVDMEQEECYNCGNMFDNEDLHECVDGELYCEDCESECFVTCEECNEQIDSDSSRHSEDGGCYCEHCYDERYFHCDACDSEFSTDDRHTGPNSRQYCYECFSDRYEYCAECNEVYRREDLIFDEESEEYICEHCRGADEERVIHDYGFRPEPEFFQCEHEKETDWEKPLYMGIELEVQRETDYKIYAQKFMKFLQEKGTDKYFYLKNDSSLENRGFEIVTHPFTLQYAHKNIGFRAILEWLEKNKMDYEKYTKKCGLHVHISKTFFEELDVTKLRLFFRQNIEQLKQFSRRNGETRYSIFETTDIKDIIAGADTGKGRYAAFSMESSRETYEIRIFRGELNKDWFIAVLQFVDAISNFVKKHGITSFIYGEGKYHKNSWLLFTDWAHDQHKYGVMLKYMKGEKLCV